jgi:hypothetical protein
LTHEAAAVANRTHGHSKSSRLYIIWSHMLQRCSNPNDNGYKHYGGRGINVCPEWQDFEPFLQFALNNGYTDELTLERKNVNGNYCPENCCFVSRRLQTRNTRRTVYINSILTIPKFVEQNQVPYDFVWHALRFVKEYPGAWELFLKAITSDSSCSGAANSSGAT